MANIKLDQNKYKAAFLYLLDKLGKIEGKKKAYKLFYFLDFDFYEAYEKSFTGDVYRALPMGPAPTYFDAIAEELQQEGYIKISKERKSVSHGFDTIIYQEIKPLKYDFSKDELHMLNRVIEKYGPLTGKELENLSHNQAPYAAVNLNDVIPYEFSLYRDTPNLT